MTRECFLELKGGMADVMREVGMALHHLEEVCDLDDAGEEDPQQAVEEVASAADALRTAALGCDNLIDQLQKLEAVMEKARVKND